MVEKTLVILLVFGWAGGISRGASDVASTDDLDTQNLIANGSFEETDQGLPLRWNLHTVEGLSWAIDREVKHEGRQSLRLTGQNIAGAFGGFSPDSTIYLRPDRIYELSLWAKANSAKFSEPGGYIIRCWGSVEKGQTLPGILLEVDNGTYDWKRYSIKYRPLAPMTLTPRDWQVPRALNGIYWIDDVSLREIEVISAYQSVPTPQLISHYKNALRSADGKLALLFAPPTKKILREMMPDENVLKGGKAGSISLARNEHEGIQVVIAALWDKETARNVEFSMTPLRNNRTGGSPAGARESWHPVGYLGFHENGKLISPPWPDILLPAQTFSVRGQELQPVWVDVYAGEETPAGDYEMFVTVKTVKPAQRVTAKIEVHVYDFTVPRRHSLPTAFGANFPGTREMVHEHRLVRRRIAGFPPQPGFHNFEANKHEFTEFAEVEPIFEKLLDEHRARGGAMFLMELPYFGPGCYSGGMFSPGGFSKHNVRYDEQDSAYIIRYYRQLAEWLREKGLLQDGYTYLWDEPVPERFENIRTNRELIRKADPEIRCMVVTTLTKELIGHVDIWVTTTRDWDEKRTLAKELVDRGEEIWWYNVPYFVMDPVQDLLGTRLVSWMIWKYQINGLLHWAVDHWRQSQGTLQQIGDSTDCWWTGGLGPYLGLGCLALPAPGVHPKDENGTMILKKGEALSTIRLEAIRDGLEDYEYFVLLHKAIEKAKVKEADVELEEAIARAEKLLTVPSEMVTSLKEYTDNDPLVRNYRDQIAQAIETLSAK